MRRFGNVAVVVAALLIQYSPSCQPFSSIDSRSHKSSPRSVVGKHAEDKGSVAYNNHYVVVRSKIDLDLSTDGDINNDNDNDVGCPSPDHEYCERKAEHNRAAAGIMGMATAQFSVAKVCEKLLVCIILCTAQTFL